MELTLNEPLTGAEIIDIISKEIWRRMEQDSNLLPDISYAGFRAKFAIDIGFRRASVKETQVWGGVAQNDDFATPDEWSHIEAEHTSNESPNIERQDHDLPIPVLVQTPTGAEKRRVKIERRKP